MANYPQLTLTGKTPSESYARLVTYNVASASLIDGLGNDIPFSASWAPAVLTVSASWASSSLSSSFASNAAHADSAPTVTVGLTSTQSWLDAATSLTNSMYINSGLVISWSYQS